MQHPLDLRGQRNSMYEPPDEPLEERAGPRRVATESVRLTGKSERQGGRVRMHSRTRAGKVLGQGALADEATDEEVAGEGHATTSY